MINRNNYNAQNLGISEIVCNFAETNKIKDETNKKTNEFNINR